MTGLKVVALISGGKDSLFSILHCLANGHDVVALANLHPPLRPDQDAVEDIDSYMYQTIGHAVIPLYQEALGLPLYRQEIVGSALNQNKSYGASASSPLASEDETESLVPLLRKVMAAHPEINAVSTGAILSDYQRTRVESVALRLGLTPLSYLWQWPSLPPHSQSSLLEDMAAVGQDSRIIKVASGGLDDSFLWQNVADQRTISRLTKASQRFGSLHDGAVLGEGGEYETLAVDGPSPLWKASLVLDEDQRQVVQGEAGSASLRLYQPRVIPKPVTDEMTAAPRTPPLLDAMFEELLAQLLQKQDELELAPHHPVSASLPQYSTHFDVDVPTVTDHAPYLFVGLAGEGHTVADQMRSIMDALSKSIPQASMSSIAYTTIILRRMADFTAINPVYGSYFTQPNPPARVTIACAGVLPDGCDVMLGATGQAPPELFVAGVRHGLHVQSRSYWAPANIGPYSQAITILNEEGPGGEQCGIVYVAGQIPLVPATMELVHSKSGEAYADLAYQTVLALQHLTRIGEATKVKRWVAAIAFVVVSPSAACATSLTQVARKAWKLLHEDKPCANAEEDEAEDFDIWNVTHGSRQGYVPMQQPGATGRQGLLNGDVPPIWIIQVDELPRGASIEWAAYGTTGESGSPTRIRHLQYLLHTFRDRIL